MQCPKDWIAQSFPGARPSSSSSSSCSSSSWAGPLSVSTFDLWGRFGAFSAFASAFAGVACRKIPLLFSFCDSGPRRAGRHSFTRVGALRGFSGVSSGSGSSLAAFERLEAPRWCRCRTLSIMSAGNSCMRPAFPKIRCQTWSLDLTNHRLLNSCQWDVSSPGLDGQKHMDTHKWKQIDTSRYKINQHEPNSYR